MLMLVGLIALVFGAQLAGVAWELLMTGAGGTSLDEELLDSVHPILMLAFLIHLFYFVTGCTEPAATGSTAPGHLLDAGNSEPRPA